MSDQEQQGTEQPHINASTHVDFDHSKSDSPNTATDTTIDAILPIERRQHKKLKPSEVNLAIRLAADGIDQISIAKRLGVTQSAISMLLKRYEPTVDAARALIHARAGKVAQQWLKAVPKAARRGDHRPAKDWLAAAGVIAHQPEQAQQVVIQIGGGTGESGPGLPDILAKVSTHE